ncbi:MAG: DUF3782 domain-containing protein [Candidatus Nezhaarchaeales archaeon]
MEISELKAKLFTLLREDLEFRYAVAGLLGLEEILRRLDRHEAELVRLREDFNRMREDFNRKAEEDSKRFTAIEAEIARLREDMIAGFKRHDEEFTKIWSEIARLREDMMEGFKRHDEEIRRLREDMIAGFKRHDEEFAKVWSEIARLREDMIAGFKRHDEEIAKLRADMMEGFNLLKRHLDALGARWGLLSEQAFREGLRSLIEKEFGFKVEKWVRWDGEGYVHGHPSDVDVDIAVHDEKIILIEIKSHVGQSDVSAFKRKAEFYERVEGRKPDRLLIVTPYADEKALETAKQLQIEVYTGV